MNKKELYDVKTFMMRFGEDLWRSVSEKEKEPSRKIFNQVYKILAAIQNHIHTKTNTTTK